MHALRYAACALLAATGVSAATLDVVVEEPTAAGKTCGLSKDALTARGRLALRAGGVQVSSSATGYLHINVTVASEPASCIAVVRIAVGQPATLVKGAQFKNAEGLPVYADVCNKGGIIVGPRNEVSSEIENAVEEYTKRCLGSLDYK